jgi:hypothetical protein
MPSALGQARVFCSSLLNWEGCEGCEGCDVPKHHGLDFTIVGTANEEVMTCCLHGTDLITSHHFSFFGFFLKSVRQPNP